jgi:RsiW-degrading membrane proteinase PrsW (M82 family)
MSDLSSLWDLLLLIVVALVPVVVYLEMVRGSERYRAESWRAILGAFAYGALFATFAAGVLESVLVGAGTAASHAYPAPEFSFLNGNSTANLFFLVLVIAPFIEEALKASGVVYYRRQIRHVADGPVLGASVGLGFGFLETLLYGLGAVFGYGYAESRVGVPKRSVTGRYYLGAVAMHSGFNALASVGAILLALGVSTSLGNLGSDLALVAAIAFAVLAFAYIRDLIAESDFPALRGGARFQPSQRAAPPRPASPRNAGARRP